MPYCLHRRPCVVDQRDRCLIILCCRRLRWRLLPLLLLLFFFQPKTAYAWRISDWSSDVCSSDLVINPFTILAATVLAPIALAVIFARGPLARTWKRLQAWHAPHAGSSWAVAARFIAYCALLLTGATIAFEALRAISFHLQIADLLYSSVEPGKCRSDLLQVRDARS